VPKQFKSLIIQVINQTIVAENFYAIDVYKAWNSLCYSFNDNTNFDAVSEFVRGGAKTITVNKKPERKIDINSCSKAQLVKLPGINTGMSMRIIKYREENNGFNSVSEFFKKFKIKDHFQRQ
jgi:DNA uptake protein ComE-like DNA-binding protein